MDRRRKALKILMRARMQSSPSVYDSPHPSFASLMDLNPLPPSSAPEKNPNSKASERVSRARSVMDLVCVCVSNIEKSSADTEMILQDFLQGYYNLSSEARQEVLVSLAEDYDIDRNRIHCLMQQYLSLCLPTAGNVEDEGKSTSLEDGFVESSFYMIERNLRISFQPKYGHFFEQLNACHGGLKFLVDLRADLLSMITETNLPSLRALDSILKEKLIFWLTPATLELQRITWDDPASLLEKIVAYEAVHPIRNLLDLKRRLSVGRRCFGYLHPAIPGEPLIFIEVALMNNVAESIQEVLWDSPPTPEKEAICALFYSISSTQAGLAGINLGKFLIKRVVQLLQIEMPHVLTFATLSPIPGFTQWLLSKLVYHKTSDRLTASVSQDEHNSTFREIILLPEEEKAIFDACLFPGRQANGIEILEELLKSPKKDWTESEQLLAILRPPLMRLCARYLLKEKKRGKALDVVANFHLQNGATIERINWMADGSGKGLQQSCGMMVNYVYKSEDINKNARSYSRSGTINSSDEINLLFNPSKPDAE